MNRLGWGVLILIVLTAGMFATMLNNRHLDAPVPLDVKAATLAAAPAPVAVAPPAAAPSGLVVPVAGIRRDQLVDSWHDAREGGARRHEALDIPAPRDTPVLAAFGGRVDKLFESARGGTTLYIRSRDGATEAYYAHLSRYADLLREGQDVRQGETIAYVGDTGDAGPGNTHLHFALAHMEPGEKWWQGTPYDPYPLLAAKARAR